MLFSQLSGYCPGDERRDTRNFLSRHRVSLFSRGVIFTRARVSPSLLSLRKNGDYSSSAESALS